MLVWIFWLTFDCFPQKKHIPTLQLPATLTGLWLSQLGPCIKDQIKLRLEPSWQIGKCQQEKNVNGLESALEHTAFECNPRLRWCFQISFLWSLSIIIFKTGKLIRIFYRIDVNGISEFSKLSTFTVTKKRVSIFPCSSPSIPMASFADAAKLPGRLANRFDWHILDALRRWRWCILWWLSFHIFTSCYGVASLPSQRFPSQKKIGPPQIFEYTWDLIWRTQSNQHLLHLQCLCCTIILWKAFLDEFLRCREVSNESLPPSICRTNEHKTKGLPPPYLGSENRLNSKGFQGIQSHGLFLSSKSNGDFCQILSFETNFLLFEATETIWVVSEPLKKNKKTPGALMANSTFTPLKIDHPGPPKGRKPDPTIHFSAQGTKGSNTKPGSWMMHILLAFSSRKSVGRFLPWIGGQGGQTEGCLVANTEILGWKS